ncbi:Asp-tRNA(Asn)/Glu-tRNA(Gln) amidotransferase A subunit family amidase [Lacibacter cauensis]|uniref:Asp-tRNA(Asn)/Glu-tRNA(Gln) amidotransferase A subunit family amidase n=1 Tax=Lacibacter cauensis TaxID=510947 RepID=A0A562SM31_9BACT|nr:amidase [Lacibacter cauensis]TWI81700.1 Asp-tRNA(Asn)/Glu-tRNA(Gln) amidotransferase A subunit family amidase [Lacibacter cauensis]
MLTKIKWLLVAAFPFCAKAQQTDTISKQDIQTAARVIALDFTEPELDSMLRDVRDNRREYSKMQSLPLNNSVPMSLWQSPVLPGMQFNSKQLPVQWNIPANVTMPKNKADLAFYSLLQLASLIKNKKISSVELTTFFIERIRKYGDTLQCVITVTEEIAMQQAKAADAELAKGKYRGPLHGIPYGLKDLFAVKGTKTTWGATPYKEQTIDEDSYVYLKLKEAGAVLAAKFTLGALAMGDWWYGGRTKNPWNLNFGSSGSSAGSASATVAGLVPFAIGTETLGSIVSPSTACGATGLRPTFGSISRSGGMTLSWSLDKVGPICRSAEDAAVVFNYIHGTDGKDASAVNMPFNYSIKKDIKKLRIGYAKNYFDRIKDTSANEWKALKAFEKMGIQLIPVIFPDSAVYNFDMVGIIIGAESAAAFDQLTVTGLDDQLTRQNKNDWPNSFRTSRLIPAVEYINANRHRYLLMQKMQTFFETVDVVITPTFGGSQLAVTNLTGHPALCMPTGFNQRKLPTSISFIGKLYDEATLLQVGALFQQATQWHEVHPPMFMQ